MDLFKLPCVSNSASTCGAYPHGTSVVALQFQVCSLQILFSFIPLNAASFSVSGYDGLSTVVYCGAEYVIGS